MSVTGSLGRRHLCRDGVTGTLPFLVPLLISLVAITAVPELSLWLPDLVLGPRP